MNNKQIDLKHCTETLIFGETNCSINFFGEFQNVEILSPSKIHYCEKCELLFQSHKKLESHKAKRNCELNRSLVGAHSIKHI